MLVLPTVSVYSIKWQKRGLPHVHILIWLVNKIRFDDIDSLIYADISDPKHDSILHEIVKKVWYMVHVVISIKAVNIWLMEFALNNFPKKKVKHFTSTTITGEDRYLQYGRRCSQRGGFSVKINCNGISTDIRN